MTFICDSVIAADQQLSVTLSIVINGSSQHGKIEKKCAKQSFLKLKAKTNYSNYQMSIIVSIDDIFEFENFKKEFPKWWLYVSFLIFH